MLKGEICRKSQNKPSLALGVLHLKVMHLCEHFSSVICSRCFVVAKKSACRWFLQFHNEPPPKPLSWEDVSHFYSLFNRNYVLFAHVQFDLQWSHSKGCLVLWWIERGNRHVKEKKELNKDNPCTNCSLKLSRFIHAFFVPTIFLKAKRCVFFYSQANLSQLRFAKTRSKGDNLVESFPETENRSNFERKPAGSWWSNSPKLRCWMQSYPLQGKFVALHGNPSSTIAILE